MYYSSTYIIIQKIKKNRDRQSLENSYFCKPKTDLKDPAFAKYTKKDEAIRKVTREAAKAKM